MRVYSLYLIKRDKDPAVSSLFFICLAMRIDTYEAHVADYLLCINYFIRVYRETGLKG